MLPSHLQRFGFTGGYLAVDLFFVLSGFVIALAYDRPLSTGMTVGRFVTLRLIRVAPVIWIGVVAGASFHLAQAPGRWPTIGLNLVLQSAFLPGIPGSLDELYVLNPPEWSLLVELVANIGFAMLFHRLRRRALLGLVAIGVVLVCIAAVTLGSLMDAGAFYWTAWAGFSRVVFSFFLGVALFRSRAAWHDRLPRLPIPLLLGAAALLMFVPVPSPFRPAYDLLAVFLVSPALVALASVVEPAVAHRRWTTVLAEISYPLYAIHFPCLFWIGWAAHQVARVKTFILAMIPALLVLSYLLARYVDEPVRRALKRTLVAR